MIFPVKGPLKENGLYTSSSLLCLFVPVSYTVLLYLPQATTKNAKTQGLNCLLEVVVYKNGVTGGTSTKRSRYIYSVEGNSLHAISRLQYLQFHVCHKKNFLYVTLSSIVHTCMVTIQLKPCILACLQEVKNHGKLLNCQPQMWLQLLTRGGWALSGPLWEVIAYERRLHMEV